MNTRDGLRVVRFIETFGRVTKGKGAGQRLVLRPWQRDLLVDLCAQPYRRALVGLPRKNGKSALGAGIALYGLIADGEPGAEVYSVAADREQARIVFGMAKRMVELDPDLTRVLKTYRDSIVHPPSGSVYKVVSAEAYTKEGLSPSLVVFDEVHAQPSDELWQVFSLAMGAREHPLLLGITTAGVRYDRTGRDSLCYGLWQYGRRIESGEIVDPSFFFRWWGAPDGADHRDPAVWAAANPAFGDFLFEEDFHSAVLSTPEAEFRVKRLNQWVSSHVAWFPAGAWEACAADDPTPPDDGADVVLAFDGSFSGDSTALVGCTPAGYVFVVDAWEKPQEAAPTWRVDHAEVEAAVLGAAARWNVLELAADPFRWQRDLAAWRDAGINVVEFPQNSRMVSATATFYDAVMDGRLSHDGDLRLARHVGNAVTKLTPSGPKLSKDHKDSPRRIDLAVAAVMAYDRAVFYRAAEAPRDPQLIVL